MGETFADKFEQVLNEKRRADPTWGLRTLARDLAKGDPKKTETIRRRLQKYRPRPGGGAAEVAPTEPTRREIERALGLNVDDLKPDEEAVAAMQPLRADMTLDEFLRYRVGVAITDRLAEIQKSNAPAAHLTASTAGASTTGG